MNKTEFKKKAKAQIDNLFSKIEDLEKKKDTVESSMKIQFQEKIESLKDSKVHLQNKYANLADEVDDKWEDVKTAFSSAAGSFEEGINDLSSLFKN